MCGSRVPPRMLPDSKRAGFQNRMIFVDGESNIESVLDQLLQAHAQPAAPLPLIRMYFATWIARNMGAYVLESAFEIHRTRKNPFIYPAFGASSWRFQSSVRYVGRSSLRWLVYSTGSFGRLATTSVS